MESYKTESILVSVKKAVGIFELDESFDVDLLMHINSVFSILVQIGIGPANGFSISGNRQVWSDFIADDVKLNLVRSYMFLKVKMLFDPPSSSAVMEAMKATANEYEWRMNLHVETKEEVDS